MGRFGAHATCDVLDMEQAGQLEALGCENWRARVFEPAVQAVQAAAIAQRAKELAATGAATTPESPTITPHDLRHTAASLAISAGANVKRSNACWATRRPA
jgi:integrase